MHLTVPTKYVMITRSAGGRERSGRLNYRKYLRDAGKIGRKVEYPSVGAVTTRHNYFGQARAGADRNRRKEKIETKQQNRP